MTRRTKVGKGGSDFTQLTKDEERNTMHAEYFCPTAGKDIRKQWKLPRTRVANLKKLGMTDWQAYRNGNTRKGYWAVAGSGILHTTITNERLARRGYYDISEAYKSMHLIGLNRRVPNGTHGGVRGRLVNE